MRAFQRDGVWMQRKIIGIQVDDIGQQRIAAFFGVEGQKLADVPGFAERMEQVFGVEPVIQPQAGGRRLVHPVHGLDHRILGMNVVIDAVDLALQRGVHPNIGMRQQDHRHETGGLMMTDGAVDLDLIFRQDQRHRPLGQRRVSPAQERIQVRIAHRRPFAALDPSRFLPLSLRPVIPKPRSKTCRARYSPKP